MQRSRQNSDGRGAKRLLGAQFRATVNRPSAPYELDVAVVVLVLRDTKHAFIYI